MPIKSTVSRLLLATASALAGLDASAQTDLPAGVSNAIRRIFGADELRYFDGVVDLNGDGKDEILVYVVGPMACGTGGCNLLVFTAHGAGYRLVSSISVVQPPVGASSHRTSGWRDLIVHVAGGGTKSRDVALAFDGKSYPSNPTVSGPRVKPASMTDAQMLIKEFAAAIDGKVLAAATDAAGPVGPPAVAALADTRWRLVEFRSMDDATGTVRPHDSSLYTMDLNGDGTVTMRLNCNRANGTWFAEPGGDGASGRFEFGPLAATHALCPPPSMDESIAAQARFVRGYLLKDGRLYLSLMADGGIYAWEPERADSTQPGMSPVRSTPASR